MSVSLSPLAGAGWQFFDNNGVPLNGGLLYTYAAGTTTPAATYTSDNGVTANANPIVLDSSGRTPSEVWLTDGTTYKIAVYTSTNVLIRTWDDIAGVNDPTAYTAAIAASSAALAASGGSALVGFIQAGASAVARTAQSKMREAISVKDFGAVGDGVTNDQQAFINTFAVISANGGGEVFVPPGTYLLNTAALTIPENLTLTGAGWNVSKIKSGGGWFCLTKTYANHTNINRLNLWARNLSFIGSALSPGGVYISLGDNCVFEKCRFSDFSIANASGLSINNCYWTHVKNCQFENIERYGIVMDAAAGVGCNATTINNRCQFIGNNQPNFIGVLTNGQNIEIAESDFSGSSNGLNGIAIQNGEGVHIHDNYIERWTGPAIRANSGGVANSRIVIDNNVLNSDVVPVVNLDYALGNSNVVVCSNRFSDISSGACIDFGNTTNALEYNNSIGTADATDTYAKSFDAVATTDNTFTATLTGVTGSVTGTARYTRQGKVVTMYLPPLVGTSNATTCTITGLPNLIAPARQQLVIALMRDNSTSDFIGEFRVETTGVLTLCRNIGSAGGFTAANTKGLLGSTITYSLD